MSLLQRSKLKFKPNIGAATTAPTQSSSSSQNATSAPSESTSSAAPTAFTQPAAPTSFGTAARDGNFLRPGTPVSSGTTRLDSFPVNTVSHEVEPPVSTQNELSRDNSQHLADLKGRNQRDAADHNDSAVLSEGTKVPASTGVDVISENREPECASQPDIISTQEETIAFTENRVDVQVSQQVSNIGVNVAQSDAARFHEAKLSTQDIVVDQDTLQPAVEYQVDAEPAVECSLQPTNAVTATPAPAPTVSATSVTILNATLSSHRPVVSNARRSTDRSRNDSLSNSSATAKRKRTAKKTEVVEPDYSTMRMADFVRYNPTHKPAMSWKRRGKGSSRNTSETSSVLNSPSKVDASGGAAPPEVAADSDQPMAPSMLRVGADGKLEINQEALTVVRRDPASDPTLPIISLDPTQRTGVYRFARRRTYSQRWSPNETLLFYKALYLVGSDFSAMEQLGCFRNRRDRRMLKNKFKKEERESCDLVHDTISRRVRVDESDPTSFHQFLARLRLDLNVALSLDADDDTSDISHADSNANAAVSSGNASQKAKSRKRKGAQNDDPAETVTPKRRTAAAKKRKEQQEVDIDLADTTSESGVDNSDVESTASDATWRKEAAATTQSVKEGATRELPSRRSKTVAQERFAEIAKSTVTTQSGTAAGVEPPVISVSVPILCVQPLPGIETLRRGVRS